VLKEGAPVRPSEADRDDQSVAVEEDKKEAKDEKG
jgi:hypothetical protein